LAINQKIIEVKSGSIGNEDMRLGAYFVKAEELKNHKAFAEKVLMYLWNDAFKYEQDKVFADDITSLDKLLEQFATERKFGVFRVDVLAEMQRDSKDTDIEESEAIDNA
jgi:hypothetical protein